MRCDSSQISPATPAPIGRADGRLENYDFPVPAKLAIEEHVLEQVEFRESTDRIEGRALGEDRLVAGGGAEPTAPHVDRVRQTARDETSRSWAAETEFEAASHDISSLESRLKRCSCVAIEPGIGVQEQQYLPVRAQCPGIQLPAQPTGRTEKSGTIAHDLAGSVRATAVDDNDLN